MSTKGTSHVMLRVFPMLPAHSLQKPWGRASIHVHVASQQLQLRSKLNINFGPQARWW
jgi:hypothetical protein